MVDTINIRKQRSKTIFDAREKIFSAVMKHMQIGSVSVSFPSGGQRTFNGVERGANYIGRADMQILEWSAVSDIMRGGAIGLAESYMAGKWATTDISNLLLVLAANMDHLESRLSLAKGASFLNKIKHLFNRNTRTGSRKNISFHYDLGNDFYQLWLDKSMTYSAALFRSPSMTLYEAQQEKYRALAEAVGIQRGDHVLEIGCGWGGFAEFAAKEYGCMVTGVTLSVEQLDYANKRLRTAGLSDFAKMELCDYRDVKGTFDHIVSIEMLEAVGESFWEGYFTKVKSLLKPGGKAGIQVITIDDHKFDAYRNNVDFIQKYIFPGGMLPSDRILEEQFRMARLRLDNKFEFGLGYADTLKKWLDSFDMKLEAIKEQGFDQRFINMWRFYLGYCEAGFRQKTIDVVQYVIAK
jgi:cyclopropane-fatty-acyl-phospholipid synthase